MRIERPFGDQRLVSESRFAGSATSNANYGPPQEMVFLGGPVTAPGYDYHAMYTSSALSQHIEWQFPVPFVPFSLGRFGRAPGRATLVPFAHIVIANDGNNRLNSSPTSTFSNAGVRQPFGLTGTLPSLGLGFLTPFDLIRLDVARGLRNGRWTFSVDVNRDFWRIL
jgi:hypothetical protein